MGYNFPASPTNGQQYGKWTFDGDAWVGGFQAQGVSNAEQFFDLSGVNSFDIAVPSWAKGVQLSGNVWGTATAAYLGMRVSMDGTTFINGATAYTSSGPYHSSAGAGSAYATFVAAGTSMIGISNTINEANTPINFETEMALVRVATTQHISARSFTKSYNTGGSIAYQTYWSTDLVNSGSMGSNLAIKALRLMMSNGSVNMQPGSFVRVKWLGDLAQQPNGVSIVDAPSDGNEYVRVNGVWRLKTQTFDLGGLTLVEFNVPTWAKHVSLKGVMYPGTTGYIGVQVSIDGTNFLTTAIYPAAGPYHQSVGGYATQATVNGVSFYLSYPQNNAAVPHNVQGDLNLVAANSSQYVSMRTHSSMYNNTGIVWNMWWTGYLNSLGPLAIKKLRVVNNPAAPIAMGANSYVSAEWL